MGDNGHADGLDGFAYQQVLVRYLEEACTAHASFRCEPAGTHPHRHRSPQHESEGTTSTDRELPREAESNSTKRLRGDAATSKQSQRLDAGTELMGSTGHPDDGHGHLRIPMRGRFTATILAAEEMRHIVFEDSAGTRPPTHHNSKGSAFTNKLT
jgi:hypothetical protein